MTKIDKAQAAIDYLHSNQKKFGYFLAWGCGQRKRDIDEGLSNPL